MRSRTEDHLPGRCRRCWLKESLCLCAELPRVELPFEVRLLRHVREGEKSTNTGRLAALALARCALVELDPSVGLSAEQVGPLDDAWLLFPEEPGSSARRPAAPVRTLVVLDGTWRQARRMFHRLPALHALPRLALPTKPEAVLRLRDSSTEGGRSTLEALADALALLEGDAVAAPLQRLHADFVERVLKARGVWEQKVRDLEEKAGARGL